MDVETADSTLHRNMSAGLCNSGRVYTIVLRFPILFATVLRRIVNPSGKHYQSAHRAKIGTRQGYAYRYI